MLTLSNNAVCNWDFYGIEPTIPIGFSQLVMFWGDITILVCFLGWKWGIDSCIKLNIDNIHIIIYIHIIYIFLYVRYNYVHIIYIYTVYIYIHLYHICIYMYMFILTEGFGIRRTCGDHLGLSETEIRRKPSRWHLSFGTLS